MSLGPMTRSCLTMQGFAGGDPALKPLAPWLRWTPALSTLLILAGTILRQALILWAFAALAFAGAAGWHAFDWLFSYSVRHVLRLPRLPRNPAPRRFGGLVAGGLLLVAAVTVSTTQFCFGSWVWRLLRPTGQDPA